MAYGIVSLSKYHLHSVIYRNEGSFSVLQCSLLYWSSIVPGLAMTYALPVVHFCQKFCNCCAKLPVCRPLFTGAVQLCGESPIGWPGEGWLDCVSSHGCCRCHGQQSTWPCGNMCRPFTAGELFTLNTCACNGRCNYGMWYVGNDIAEFAATCLRFHFLTPFVLELHLPLLVLAVTCCLYTNAVLYWKMKGHVNLVKQRLNMTDREEVRGPVGSAGSIERMTAKYSSIRQPSCAARLRLVHRMSGWAHPRHTDHCTALYVHQSDGIARAGNRLVICMCRCSLQRLYTMASGEDSTVKLWRHNTCFLGERNMQRCCAAQSSIPFLCFTGVGVMMLRFLLFDNQLGFKSITGVDITGMLYFLYGLNPLFDFLCVFIFVVPYQREVKRLIAKVISQCKMVAKNDNQVSSVVVQYRTTIPPVSWKMKNIYCLIYENVCITMN